MGESGAHDRTPPTSPPLRWLVAEFRPPLSLEPEAGDSTPPRRQDWLGGAVGAAEAPALHENAHCLSVVPALSPLPLSPLSSCGALDTHRAAGWHPDARLLAAAWCQIHGPFSFSFQYFNANPRPLSVRVCASARVSYCGTHTREVLPQLTAAALVPGSPEAPSTLGLPARLRTTLSCWLIRLRI